MFFFFPYSTDAPVYHWPYGTIGLIVLNVLLFFGVPSVDVTPDSPWLLAYGGELRPDQWFGSRFMHDGFGHLFGNMTMLWAVGLVVEGKLGAARFVPLYLLMAVAQAAAEQAMMLGYQGPSPGSVGASAAIYGVMAIAAVWAPVNEINFGYFYFLLFIFGAGSFGAPVGAVAAFYVGFDLLFAFLSPDGISSSILHLMGAALGFPLGVMLLKRKVVDCEGWDLFTRFFNDAKPKKKSKADLAKEAAEEARRTRESGERDARVLEGAREQVVAYLEAGNPVAAATLYRKMAGVGGGVRLDAPTLHRIVAGLQAEGRWAELAPLLRELIDLAPQSADALRVKLAQVCVAKLGRPGRALELLAEVQPKALTEKQLAAAKQVAAKARAMQHEGVVELDDGQW